MIYKYMYLLNFTQVTHKPPIHAYIILPFVMISSTKNHKRIPVPSRSKNISYMYPRHDQQKHHLEPFIISFLLARLGNLS